MPSSRLDEDLVDTIAQTITADPHQYREVVPPAQLERVDLLRRCGRAAGRRRKVPVRTFVTELRDGSVEVWIVNTQPPDPDDEVAQARLRRRMRAVVDAAYLRPVDDI